jgi:CubicO group peptidase (beta-lactamase class C family)
MIFDKLAMTDSTFDYPLPEAYIAQMAAVHRSSGDPVPGKWHIYPEKTAAGLWSTPSDLARWLVEVLKSDRHGAGIVCSAEMIRQMLTRQSDWYGLGFWIFKADG